MKKPAPKKPAKTKKAKRTVKTKAAKPRSGKRRPGIMRHSREGMRKPGAKRAGGAAGQSQSKRGYAAAQSKRAYLDRLRAEFPTTLRVMRAFPGHAADFQPHEKSKSALNLVHTFAIENWGALQSTKGELLPPRFPPVPPTLEEAIDAYERGVRELEAAVEGMPDSRLSETVMFFSGPGKMAPMPVIDVLWYMLFDSIHHRGQLSVYVRQAGGKVPSIYGPTADEPWR